MAVTGFGPGAKFLTAGAYTSSASSSGGLLSLLGGPVGIGLFAGQIGIQLLFKRIFAPDLEPLPVKTHTLSGGREQARWCFGERRFPLEWTDGTSLPNPRYIDNHIRLIGCVSMDPCEAVATSIWLNQDPFALRVDPAEAGALIPPVGSDYILRPEDVREYSFPTKYALTVRPKLLADGTQWGTTAGTATGRNAYAPPEPGDDTRREYNGRGGSETSWGAARTNATTRVRDWVQTCSEGYTYDPDQNLCVNDDDPSLTETAREVIIREFEIGLEVKVIDASYKLMGIAGVQVDAFQPFFQQAGTKLARERPDTAKRLYTGIPDIDIRLQGKKITWPGQPTPKYTANPIAILYWLDTVYRGIPAATIDETEFASAYAACEELLTYRYGAGVPATSLGADGEWYVRSNGAVYRRESGAWMAKGTTQGDYEWFSGRGSGGVVQIPRYRCHIEIESGQRIDDIYRRILASCAGARFEWRDKIRYRVGVTRAVSLRVLEGDVIGFEQVVPITDLGARINKYTARMTQSEQNDWLPDTVAYEDAEARARDGELRTTEYTLDAVTDPIQAFNITSVLLKQGRVNGAWVVRVGYFPDMEQAAAATYDIWEITHSAMGLDRQRVEVQWARVQPDGTVVALVHQHPEGTYDPVLALPDLPQRPLNFGVPPVPEVTGLRADAYATKLVAGTIINHLTATCDTSDTFDTRFEYRPTPISNPDGSVPTAGWLPMAFAGQRAEVSPVTAGQSYDVRAYHVDRSRGYGPPAQIEFVVPRFLTPEGVGIWVGDGPPNDDLGEDGDIYLERGGNRWYKREGTWVDSGQPAGGTQGFVTFEATASESVPRPYPTVIAPDGTVAYNLVTGQQWLRVRGIWVYKGDLTGPPGQPGAGIAAWDADAPPTAEDGLDGDIWRLHTGVWYRKVDGAWVLQTGTIGRSGTRVIPIDGEGPPLRPDTFTPPAEDGDLAFAAGSLRFYELQSGSWIEIADLSPQRTYVFSAAQETAPTPATLPEINATGAGRVRSGDEARNQRTGEIWRATRAGSTVTWMQVGDATLKGGFTVGSADPPASDGIVYGEVYVSTTTDKRYVWTRQSAGTGAWIHDGYVHASEWIFSDALPAQGERTPGDIYVVDNDIYCINDDLSATLCGTLTGDPEPSDPNYLVPGDCTVFFTHSEYGKPNHVGKINDGWLDASGRYGTKASSATDTGGTWPTAKQLPGAAPLIIRTAADPDDILPPRYVGPSRLFSGTLYHVITAGDDIGEIWIWNPMTRRNEQTNPPILLCGVARITAGTVTPPTFTDRNISMTVQSDGTVRAGLQWTGGVGTGFHVRYREVGGAWLPVTEITLDDGTKRNVRYHIIVTVLGFLARSYAVTGLKPSTRYEFAVRTVGASSQTSRWVQASRLSSAIPRPAAPTRVTGAESTIVDGRVNVDWVRPSSWARAQITSITVELYRGNPVSTSSVTPVASTVASGTADSAVFSDVRAGGYTAHVYATNPSGDGPVRRSTQFSVVRNPTAPPPSAPLLTPWSPTGFFVTIQSPHAARLEWDTYQHRPNGRATYLEWRYGTAILGRTNPAYQAMSAWATAGAPVGTGTGIGGRFQENVLYRFQLRAVNASGASGAASFNPRWSGD